MGARITERIMPTRAKLRAAEQRLSNVHMILSRYLAVDDGTDPRLVGLLDELWFALHGYSRR